MFSISINQTIALAGLYQSLSLVQQVAWEGETTHSCLIPTIDSILKIDAHDYIDVYGSVENLYLGLRTLKETIEKRRDQRALERTRYVINLMYLENKLEAQPRIMSSIGGQIERIKINLETTDFNLADMARDLAAIYRENISPLGPKIIVEGNPTYLKEEQNACIIRTLLLSGIRALMLWRQAGGKRWSLLFGRSSILKNITDLEHRL